MNPSFSLGLAILAACGAGASCSPAPRQMPPLTAPSITPSAADWEVPGRADPGTTPCSGPFGWVELERWTEAVDLLAGATWKPLTPELARRLGGPALAVEPPPECQPFLLRGVMVLDDSNDDPASPPTGLTVRLDHATVRVAHLGGCCT